MALEDDSSRTEVAPGVELPDRALRFTFARSGGPGGQHVNKTATAATLTVHLDDLAEVLDAGALARLRRVAGRWLVEDPDRLMITDASSRSQVGNRRACVAKLRALVVEAMRRPRRRKKTRPSAAARRRRLEAKQQRGELKRSRGIDRRPPKE